MTPTLSKILWGLDWHALLPTAITDDGVSVEASDYDRALPFIADHYAEIFEDDANGAFRSHETQRNKERYYRAAGDFFEFVHRGTTIALLVGTPIDWGSYYLRSAAALPEYQGRKIIQRFFPFLFAELRTAGIDRVEADASPANMATLQLLTRMRFNVVGTQLNERWGALVHLVKYLEEEPENVFLDQFCSGVLYQRRERAREKEEGGDEEALRTQLHLASAEHPRREHRSRPKPEEVAP